MTPATEKAAPIPADGLAFGDAVTNIAASDDNPIKHGWFIRRGRRSGRVNAGSFVEYATADGRLHQTPPDNIAPRDAEPVFRADRASQEERIREDERQAATDAEAVIGRLQTLVYNVCGWVSRGQSETAVKTMDAAMEDGWTAMGWRQYLEAKRTRQEGANNER